MAVGVSVLVGVGVEVGVRVGFGVGVSVGVLLGVREGERVRLGEFSLPCKASQAKEVSASKTISPSR